MQLQVPIFIRLGDIGEEREKNMLEKKWNYAKHAPQCLQMLRKAMLHSMKAIIDVKGGVTKYWPLHAICAQQMNHLKNFRVLI